MIRLFVPAGRIENGRAPLSPGDAAYLGRVLRLSPGAEVEVFDGAGGAFAARIERLSADGGELSIVSARREAAAAARPALELWPGLPKGEKLEWVVQKAVELGAGGVVPLLCRRSVPRLDAARRTSRLARWRKVAAEAARQCGRADVPAVAEPSDVAGLCARARSGVPVAVLHTDATPPGGLMDWLLALPRETPRVAIAVGPEGGFEPDEIAALEEAGAAIRSFGRRTLRTETAGVTACAIWALAAGELG